MRVLAQCQRFGMLDYLDEACLIVVQKDDFSLVFFQERPCDGIPDPHVDRHHIDCCCQDLELVVRDDDGPLG